MMIIGKGAISDLRRLGLTALTVTLLVGITLPAIAEEPGCTTEMQGFDWKTAVEKPQPPEKTVPEVPDAGINPAKSADTDQLPFKLAGKFRSSVNNESRYCTAIFVDRNILLTAAHCVRDRNGTWLDRFTFTPSAELGPPITVATCVATSSSWVSGNKGRFHWPGDYAFVVLEKDVSQDFAVLETSPILSDEIATAIGFPESIDGGRSLQMVEGIFLSANQLGETAREGEGTGMVVHGDPRLGLGMSGGAWLVPPKEGDAAARHRVLGISVTSRLVAAYGPRMQQCAVKLLDFARSGCGLK